MSANHPIRKLLCQKGATAIEYALIVAAIAVAISVVVFTLGDEVFELYNKIKGILS